MLGRGGRGGRVQLVESTDAAICGGHDSLLQFEPESRARRRREGRTRGCCYKGQRKQPCAVGSGAPRPNAHLDPEPPVFFFFDEEAAPGDVSLWLCLSREPFAHPLVDDLAARVEAPPPPVVATPTDFLTACI